MNNTSLNLSTLRFNITIEVVPPLTYKIDTLISQLRNLNSLDIDGFSVANNPLAKPRMDALASSFLIQQYTEKPTILHCITRDENRLSIQSKLLGAKALNINTVLIMTGDILSSDKTEPIKIVQDIDVFQLITYARKIGLYTGVVIGQINRNQKNVERFKKKVDFGAQFVVTQPVYSKKDLETIQYITKDSKIPIMMGVMPIQNVRHAKFLDEKVAGISIPSNLIERISNSENELEEGSNISAEMLYLARSYFDGACIMPPFNRFEDLYKLIKNEKNILKNK